MGLVEIERGDAESNKVHKQSIKRKLSWCLYGA